MRVQVFDIGNSHLKSEAWEIDGESGKLVHDNHVPTPKDVRDSFEHIRTEYNHVEKDAVIVLSMSDSIVYESPSGYPVWLPSHEPTHPYARREQLPPYRETGKPHGEVLQGVFNQLLMVKPLLLNKGFSKTRILPFSTFIAASLAGDKSWRKWDLTHASNSGVFSYQLPSSDARFPNSGWHPCIEDILEQGWIDREIVRSDHVLPAEVEGTPILVGGHDTTFANANHGIYSTKPYISCGTWLTVSVESSVRPNWVDDGARYVAAPNGAILKQLCFPSPSSVIGKRDAAKRVSNFLSKHLQTERPITVFGNWQKGFIEYLSGVSAFKFQGTHANYLSEQAARFAATRVEEWELGA